jgi:hypothetical protein
VPEPIPTARRPWRPPAPAELSSDGAGPAAAPGATFGQDKQLPWVAYASPVLPAGSRVTHITSLDSAGRAVGAEPDPFEGIRLCPPSP